MLTKSAITLRCFDLLRPVYRKTHLPGPSQRDPLFLNRFQEGKALMAVEERPISH